MTTAFFLFKAFLLLLACLGTVAAAAWTDLPAPVCNLAGFVVMASGVVLFL